MNFLQEQLEKIKKNSDQIKLFDHDNIQKPLLAVSGVVLAMGTFLMYNKIQNKKLNKKLSQQQESLVSSENLQKKKKQKKLKNSSKLHKQENLHNSDHQKVENQPPQETNIKHHSNAAFNHLSNEQKKQAESQAKSISTDEEAQYSVIQEIEKKPQNIRIDKKNFLTDIENDFYRRPQYQANRKFSRFAKKEKKSEDKLFFQMAAALANTENET